MKVRFYNFSKRKNSTLQPTSTYTEKDVAWKDETSTHDPSVICSGGPNMSWTYAYIPDWDKYYFVEDAVTLDLTRTEYILTEDVMATHKTEIGSTSTRVIYCTNPYYSTIIDSRLGVFTTRKINKSNSGTILNSTGCYIFTVLAGGNTSCGIGTTYVCTEAAMGIVSMWLTTKYADFASYFKGTPMEGIFSLIWVPFAFPTGVGTLVTDMVIGERTASADGYSFGSGDLILLNVPGGYSRNFQTSLATNLRYPATDFRAIEPYTTGTLFLPGIGVVEVSQSDFLGGTINIDVTQDYMTGDLFYKLYTVGGLLSENIIATYTCNVGAQCPYGQITGNISGTFGGLATITGGLVTGIAGLAAGNMGAAAAGAGAIMAGTAQMTTAGNRRQASVSGSVGGRGWSRISVDGNYGAAQHIEVSMDTEDPEDSSGYIAIKGRPLDEVVTISSCNGYIECDNAQVNITGSARERDEINAMMNSGFYYE